MQTEHRNHTITVNQTSFLFEVKGPHCTHSFDSFRAAKAAIDDAIETAMKQTITANRLSIEMWDDKGNPIVVRGINRNDGTVLGANQGMLYPKLDWIGESLKERTQLILKTKEISNKIQNFGVSPKVGYGRISLVEYDIKLTHLLKAIKDKTEAAKEAAP